MCHHVTTVTEIQMCGIEPFCCDQVLSCAVHFVVLTTGDIEVCCVVLCSAVLNDSAVLSSVLYAAQSHCTVQCAVHYVECSTLHHVDFNAALSCVVHRVSVIDIM